MQEQDSNNNGSMLFEEAMSQALSDEQLSSLTDAQASLLTNRVGLLLDRHGEMGVTPEMIEGAFEIVTEHLLPSALQT